ncbi:MAG: hypothetical protein U0W40_05295 [Acidimicrobiia bacterium]
MTAAPINRMGHLATHYREGDEHLARLLLEDLGFTLLDNGPRPGEDGFCTALVDGDEASCSENIIFLSKVSPFQQALEDAITESLGWGTDHQHPALTEFLDRRDERAEAVAHFGIRYSTFERLERVIESLERDASPGGPLHGRVTLYKRIAPPRFSDSIDATMAGSKVFAGVEQYGPAKNWVQCRIVTDVLAFGLVAVGAEFELNYVFPEWFEATPSFAPAVPPSA